MNKEILETMYKDLLTLFGDYHTLCISMDSCKDCPIEEVCESLVAAQTHLTATIERF